MAEVLFKDLVRKKGKNQEDWRIASAGIWAMPGYLATLTAILAMQKLGLSLDDHRSQFVSELLLENYNLILCMEAQHKSFIKKNFPCAKDKVFLLSEMIGNTFEIDDPVGGSLSQYLDTADLLNKIMDQSFLKIKQLS